METFIDINTIYLLTAVPFTVIIFLIFRVSFKVTKWHMTDLFTVLHPGILYALLYMNRFHRLIGITKSLGNIITESIFIGIGCGLIFLVRAILGKKFPNDSKKFSLLGILLMVVLTVCVYIFTPSLPE